MKNDLEKAKDELKPIDSEAKKLSKRLSLKEKLKRIDEFSDSEYLADKLRKIAEDFEYKNGETRYFLKETADSIERLFKLTMDIKKILGLYEFESGNKDPEFLRIDKVMEITTLSKTGVYEAMKSGEFPKQVRINTRSGVWVRSEVTDWAEKKIRDRDT